MYNTLICGNNTLISANYPWSHIHFSVGLHEIISKHLKTSKHLLSQTTGTWVHPPAQCHPRVVSRADVKCVHHPGRKQNCIPMSGIYYLFLVEFYLSRLHSRDCLCGCEEITGYIFQSCVGAKSFCKWNWYPQRKETRRGIEDLDIRKGQLYQQQEGMISKTATGSEAKR